MSPDTPVAKIPTLVSGSHIYLYFLHITQVAPIYTSDSHVYSFVCRTFLMIKSLFPQGLNFIIYRMKWK